MKTVAVTEVDTVSHGRRVFYFFSKLEKNTDSSIFLYFKSYFMS